MAQLEEPYLDVTVKMYPLTASGGIDTSNSEEPLCQMDNPSTEQNEADTRWGCTAYPGDETLAYPYSTNPTTVSIETDYLLDVIPREMGTAGHHDLGLQAQAIAARTYAYCAIRYSQGLDSWNNCNREINNSNTFQVFVPHYFDTLSADDQTRIQNAVANILYMGDAAEPNRGAIFAEFSADAYLTTAAGDYNYLKSIQDPISYDPAIPGIISSTGAHQRGMSQNGANRWAWGNSSRLGEGDPWSVRWDDHRQILVHYYTGIDILDGSGNKVAPDDRWSLLWHDNFGLPVGEIPILNNAQPRPLQLQLQNTSVSDWVADEITLGYQWTVRGADADPANWLELTTLLALEKGDSTPDRSASPFTVSIPAPCGTGEYTLHLDLKRTGGNWFSTGGWPEARIDVSVTLTPLLPANGRGYYSDGLGVYYYNDQDDGQWQIGGPITWQTFSPPIIFSGVEPSINFDTDMSSPAPGVNSTFWSAVWDGNLYVPQTGQYRFYLGGLDDGGRLKIDGTTRIESWVVQGPHEYFSPLLDLSQGLHSVRVEYAQGPGEEAGLSVCWEGPGFSKEVIGASGVIPGQPTATPFMTPTPIQLATPTSAVTPTSSIPPTPEPWGQWFAAEEAALQDESPQVREEYSNLLSRTRDEVMLPDPKGDAYIRLIYRHAPEVTTILLNDANLRQDTRTLMLEVRPLLEDMLDGKTDGARLPAAWVKRSLSLLKQVETKSSPSLKREIRWWRIWLPRFENKTGREIWEMLPLRTVGTLPRTEGNPEELILQSLSAEDARAFGRLLSRVRDEVMRPNKGGEVYVALVYRYTPEVTGILLGDEALRKEAESLLLEVKPGIQSLLEETKEQWRFTENWIKRMDTLLAKLTEKGSAELQDEAAWWRERLPEWTGKTPHEVWDNLLRQVRTDPTYQSAP